MAFSEDLSIFINTDTPGYANAIIGVNTIVGLFDNGYRGFELVGSSDPTLLCADDDIVGVADGTSIVVNGVTYTVAGAPEPDGHGLTLLQLRRSS